MNTAIYAQLSGNAGLTAMLGHDPATNGPAIYYDHRNEKSPQTLYPAIIFRECVTSPRHGMDIAGDVYGVIQDEFYDFTVEQSALNSREANAVTNILETMDPLLHMQQLVMGTPTKNFNYRCLRIPGGSPSIYDSTMKVWRGMYRYQMIMAHA